MTRCCSSRWLRSIEARGVFRMGSSRIARPILVAIVGGSGSGKSWLADKLASRLTPNAARLSLDSFYRDQSHLPPARRERINYDHPRAVDWPAFEKSLKSLLTSRSTRLPSYDFATHSRRARSHLLKPKLILLIDGLWLLRCPSIRGLLSYSVFLDCPMRVRLRRRLVRDLQSRGRTATSVRRQFLTTVQPMHARFVAPQARRATLVYKTGPDSVEIGRLAHRLRLLAGLA